jgi:SAM-dependent methyltransferase
MQREHEARFVEVEATHPWFVARRALFAGWVDDARDRAILDFGCGTGSLLRELRARGHAELEGVEPAPGLRAVAADLGVPLHTAWPARLFDVIFLLDVLEHIADDRGTLAEARAHLRPGGRLFLSVPAHPCLWSRHDEQHLHQRRYTKRELVAKLRAAGFRITKLSYWNTFSFLPLATLRLLKLEPRASELDLGNPFVHAVLHRALALENRLVRRLYLPFGVSLIAVAEPDPSGPEA